MSKTYEIGHRKPPKHTQWKKGQSGNPAGRPKKPASVPGLVAMLLGQRVVVRKGKTTKRVTRLEHLLSGLIEKAIAGDARLIKMALDEASKEDARKAQARENEPPAALDSRDREVIAALMARLTRGSVPRRAAKTESAAKAEKP